MQREPPSPLRLGSHPSLPSCELALPLRGFCFSIRKCGQWMCCEVGWWCGVAQDDRNLTFWRCSLLLCSSLALPLPLSLRSLVRLWLLLLQLSLRCQQPSWYSALLFSSLPCSRFLSRTSGSKGSRRNLSKRACVTRADILPQI